LTQDYRILRNVLPFFIASTSSIQRLNSLLH